MSYTYGHGKRHLGTLRGEAVLAADGEGEAGIQVWRRRKALRSHLKVGRGRVTGRIETPKGHDGEGDDKNA